MNIIPENKFAVCRIAKDLYTTMDRLGLLQGIIIDQRKLLVCICNQYDQGKSGNPVTVDIDILSTQYFLPGLTGRELLTMAAIISQKFFWLKSEDKGLRMVRFITKIEAQGKTFRFFIDEELLALLK